MKKFNSENIVLILLVIVGVISIFFLANTNGDKNKNKVYFVSKSTSENRHFWSVLEEGAKDAATSHDMELIIVGPEKEMDIDEQIKIMEDLVNKKPYGIIIAATDYELLGDICDKALSSGIILVAVDSDVNTKTRHSVVATNNRKAANRVAKMAREQKNACKYAIVSHVKGVKTTTDRVVGFKEEMDRSIDNEFVGEYCSNNNLDGAIEATKKILDENKVDVIFGTNETTLQGIAQVIDERGLSDEVMILGFDTNEKIVSYLETGVIDYTMVQQPFNMGYLAIEQLRKVRTKGISNIDTKAVMVDKDSLFEGANARLVFPIDLSE